MRKLANLEFAGKAREPEHAKVRRAILQGLVDTEQRAVLSNLLAWLVTAGAAVYLPTAKFFVFPLIFRLVAMAGTRTAFARMRAALASEGRIKREFNWLAASLMVGGAAWGATIMPLMAYPTIHPARLLVGGSTLIGMSIVITMLSPVRRLALSFAGGLLGAYTLGLWATGAPDALVLTLGMLILFLIFIAYSHASTFAHTRSAQLLVENRRLGSDLQASLERALHLAEHDGLTGLLNRRAFFAYAEHVDWPQRVVIMIDIDHFKTINDRFGHAVGDTVLERVGRAIGEVLAEHHGTDHIASRLGGEEFAVVLRDGSDSETRDTIDALHEAVKAIGRDMTVTDLDTTTSMGIATMRDEQTLDDALQQADAALYLAKANGRNRAEWADTAGKRDDQIGKGKGPVRRKRRTPVGA